MKLIKLIAAVALTVSAVSSANAFVLYSGLTGLEDDNLEQLIKGAGNSMAGVVEVGDRLRGVIEFPEIKQLPGGASQFPISPELTGIFDTTVIGMTNPDGTVYSGGPLANFIFGPTATAFGNGALGGVMVELFTGGTNLEVNSCWLTSVAACEIAAGDGVLWAKVGFGDADDQWSSTASPVSFASLLGVAASSSKGDVNYALSILVNNTGYQFAEQSLDCLLLACGLPGGDNKTDVIGSGTIQGGSGLNLGGGPVQYGARSDIQLQLNVIPEPGSLALFSLALVGLGFATRRRNS